MASANEYREALKGTGPIPPAQGIYEMSETAKAVLGQRIEFHDGRVFRYAKAGASNLAPGKLVQAGTINAAGYLNKACAAAAVGAYSVTVTTSAAVTTGEEGYLQINDASGEGIQYKIKKTAANATTATKTDVTLYDPIATALTASSEATIILNPYEAVVICAATTDIVLGVPPITVTAEYYFWLQTWGLACVLAEGTPPAGNMVTIAAGTMPGGTTIVASDIAPTIGRQVLVGVNGEYKPVFLMITP
uniref:Uncharacterized protein n=1 Tax=viral metagenome TaxID=1070528 RepID=A0A6M3KIV1_9ZZZZ